MPSLRRASLLLFSTCVVLYPQVVAAWNRGQVEKFAELPPGSAGPEGITVDVRGNLYVGTRAADPAQPGKLFVFDQKGRLLRQVTIAGASGRLLGLAFHPQTDELLVLDAGNAQVLSVNSFTGAATVFSAIPHEVGQVATPNALTFDDEGNVYVSDSSQGIIWRIAASGGVPDQWVVDPLLRTAGTPAAGANGLGFNSDASILFVANTGDDRIIRIPIGEDGTPGAPAVFVNSINGADGLVLDEQDNLWVAANQADEVVVVDPTGRVIAKLGDFGGIDDQGSPIGLLFPATPVRFGDWIYVTNFSLNIGIPPAVDSPWTAQVRIHTIARIRARIPGIPGAPGAP